MKSDELKSYPENEQKGIFVYQDDQFKFANQRFLDIMGWDSDDMQDKCYLDHVLPNSQEEINSLLNNIFHRNSAELPEQIRYHAIRKNGAQIKVKLNPYLINYDNKPALLGNLRTVRSCVDLSDRNNREPEYKWHQNFPEITYVIDKQGRFIFVSNAIQRLGWATSELIGRHFSHILHPEEYKKVSKEAVLPKYRHVITGNYMAPKLFDERRTGQRKTSNLQLKLVANHNQEENSVNYYETAVEASGLYKTDDDSDQAEQIGTVGIISKQSS
jgi:PAS domain S-box-containing protein